MTEALVSVIVPSFGRPDFLSRAVHSVANQTWLTIEIIVVDDNGKGTENQKRSAHVVTDFDTSHTVRYITNDRNMGGGFTRNVGVAAATGKFIAFLDDDDEWLPEFISRGVTALEAVTADVCYCDCFVVENGHRASMKLEENQKYDGQVWPHLVNGWCPSSTSLFILRKSAIAGRRLFDESLSSFQDYDCWLSLSKTSYFTFHNEPSVIKHRHLHGQITTNTAARRKALEKLKSKWLPQMQNAEKENFVAATARFGNDIVRMEYKQAIQQRAWRNAASYAARYLKVCNFSLRSIYILLRSSW
jgi:glycosyltransferase involved in cell wall biosynthesis